MPPAGILSIVATPIGNLQDMSARAVETLRACDRVAAEDTRRTRGLLTHFGIGGKPIEALHAHSTEDDVARLVGRMEEGEHVAIVTDAGTPAESDPGGEVVRLAIARGIRVVPIPGPSAVLAALAASGLARDAGFRFVGFLARDGVGRGRRWRACGETPEPVVLFESPNRTQGTLRDLAAATPERAACVARELTKLHEEIARNVRLACGARPRMDRGDRDRPRSVRARSARGSDRRCSDRRADRRRARARPAREDGGREARGVERKTAPRDLRYASSRASDTKS